jgi:hypothetical protein
MIIVAPIAERGVIADIAHQILPTIVVLFGAEHCLGAR